MDRRSFPMSGVGPWEIFSWVAAIALSVVVVTLTCSIVAGAVQRHPRR